MLSYFQDPVRKRAEQVGWCLCAYIVLRYLVFFLEPYVRKIYVQLIESDAEQQEILYQQLQNQADYSGISSIVAVALGVVLLQILFCKSVPPKSVFQSERSMTLKNFVFVFCLFFGTQMLYSVLGNGLECILELCGWTALGDTTTSSTDSTETISLFLYTAIIAPIGEELIYRGFVMRSFQKNGKIYAIVMSAFLFSVMHGDFLQMIFAFLSGLVLGYVATEYSIIWSMLLHVCNNLLYGEVLSYALSGFSATVQDYVYRYINIFFFAVGAFWLLRKKDAAKAYLEANKTSKHTYFVTFTAIGILLFILWYMYTAITSLSRL